MMLRSKHLLLELLLSICVCCHLAAPLGRIDRLIGASPRHIEELRYSSSANEPIKVLRSTDRDIIIQIRRSPIRQSNDEDLRFDKDALDQSEDSVYNKHTKSKLKSIENLERDTNDNKFDGKEIVKDRISRVSMHKLPSILKPFESKEYRFKDKNKHSWLQEAEYKETVNDRKSRLSIHKLPQNLNSFESKEFQEKDKNDHRSSEQREHTKPYQEGKHTKPYQKGNSRGNTNPYNFEEYINKDAILDMEVTKTNSEDNGFEIESSYSTKRPKDEENKGNKMEPTEHNFSDNRKNSEGFPSTLSLDDKENKRALNEESSNVSEHKSSLNKIHMKMKRHYNFEESKKESVHQIQSENKDTDSVNTPNSRKISLRTISFKRNDFMETEKPEASTKSTTIIQDIKNTLNDGQNKLLIDQKEPLRNKIIKIRSPTLDSLQDLKRKFNIDHRKPSLLPGPSVLLPRKDRLQTYGAPPRLAPPPVYAPPNGQYLLQQRPRPTEDPVLQAERTKTALQRMILFVNAMGKFDYYVSNAARNFVDLLTHHTHEYDETIRSRYSGKNQHEDHCGGEKDKRDGNYDRGDDKAGYVRIRTSKTKRYSHENDERKRLRNQEGPYSVSGEYGW